MYKGSESLSGPLRPVSNVGHWKYSWFKGDAGGKGRMSNKVDIFGSSATLGPDVSFCFYYCAIFIHRCNVDMHKTPPSCTVFIVSLKPQHCT